MLRKVGKPLVSSLLQTSRRTLFTPKQFIPYATSSLKESFLKPKPIDKRYFCAVSGVLIAELITNTEDNERILEELKKFETADDKYNAESLSHALNLAARKPGSSQLLAALLKKGAKIQEETLSNAVECRSIVNVKVLLQNGADVSTVKPHVIARSRFSGHDIEKYSEEDRTAIVSILLSKGLDPMVALEGLVFTDEAIMDQIILAVNKLDISKWPHSYEMTNQINMIGSIPCKHPVNKKLIEKLFNALKDKGYQFNSTNDIYALHNAVRNKNEPVIELLIKAGVPLKDSLGNPRFGFFVSEDKKNEIKKYYEQYGSLKDKIFIKTGIVDYQKLSPLW